MAVTGVIAAVGTVASGVMGAMSAGKAADAARGPMNAALAYQEGIYSDATKNLTPWITGGQEALGGMEGFLGLGDTSGQPGSGSGALASYNQFTKTPYYTFPLQQATDTMDRAAASKGLSLSGGQLADLGKYSAGYSAQNFANYLDALNKLSGAGQSSAGTLAQVGTQVGQQVGATQTQIAGINSQEVQGQTAGIQKAIGGLTNLIAGTPTQPAAGTGSSYGYQGGLFGQGGLFAQSGGGYTGPTNAVNPSADPMGIFRTTPA